MLKFILIATVGLLLACSNSKEVHSDESQQKKYEVVISATTTQVYCGGARPTEELRTPIPASNVFLYLRKGDTNFIQKEIDYQLKTDDSGRAKVNLPAGTYSIVFENKKDVSVYNELLEKYGKETSYQTAIDTSCLTSYFKQPNAILKVKENGENEITVNRKLHCQWTRIPCSHYKGDLPPSAPPK